MRRRAAQAAGAATSTSARPCLAEYGLDEKLKALLATKCCGEHAPDGLKDRLRQSIREIVLEQAEVTVESGPEGTTSSRCAAPA